MLFCPTCANCLIIQLDDQGNNKWSCHTCPYEFPIIRQMTTRQHLKRKEVDDVMGGEESWKNVDSIDGAYLLFCWRSILRDCTGSLIFDVWQCRSMVRYTVPCPKCENPKAFFMQLQIRSADEPMSVHTATTAMCVIFWTTKDPHYHLIIASNRDEYLSRPTLPASWHDFSSPTSSSTTTSSISPLVLSARDSTGGGTWLGVTRNGSWASLTNFTEQSAPLPAGLTAFESRGALVRDWLVSQTAFKGKARELDEVQREIEEYLSEVGSRADRYPGFNLLIAALSSSGVVVGYTTNRTTSGSVSLNTPPTIFSPTSNTPSPNGLSNSIITSPWSKINLGSHTFTSILSANSADLQEQLFDLLWTSSHPPPTQRSELRDSILISPLQLPGVQDAYATRTSTVILIGLYPSNFEGEGKERKDMGTGKRHRRREEEGLFGRLI
ncbi:hypothetical protein PHSY_000774 [Pseudozyma hubeiensis SY62]|uniref:TFIIS-type domain-containing protein n=1 Tax=Pseudozyma hubeiensis (strain SY62) TaxID=1305764 RepID=R9NXB2_PSEHS|nr:hypothetical protein PHSY_000774 [Pseudozyma hubeiensis SY62]GAC93211.1 hypothetical protein PHSY_000774 [Pseudozyma hubeiensis SY62]